MTIELVNGAPTDAIRVQNIGYNPQGVVAGYDLGVTTPHNAGMLGQGNRVVREPSRPGWDSFAEEGMGLNPGFDFLQSHPLCPFTHQPLEDRTLMALATAPAGTPMVEAKLGLPDWDYTVCRGNGTSATYSPTSLQFIRRLVDHLATLGIDVTIDTFTTYHSARICLVRCSEPRCLFAM